MSGRAAPGWLVDDGTEVPPDDTWLTPHERAAQARFTVSKRRTDWRLGRWTAKQAVAAWLARDGRGVDLGRVGIVARGARDGFPLLEGVADPVPVVSLSHRDRLALCVVGPPAIELGCDLESIEPRSATFVEDWFTERERQQMETTAGYARDELVTAAWCAKESVLKALGVGLRRDTRSVDVDLVGLATARCRDDTWEPFGARDLEGGTRFRCWARRAGSHLMVVATGGAAAPQPPRQLFLRRSA